VSAERENAGVAARGSRLVVFREGLAKGVPGDNHLAWETEVGNGADVREFVYTDAHTGKLVDRIKGVHEALNRRAYNGLGLTTVPPSYPAAPYWVEGQTFPTASAEANNMITASKETYDFFSNAFRRDSFDGAGKTMDAIFNRGYSCPNASWNGTFISFCPGMTSDDVTGHEWAHAYTEYTHGLSQRRRRQRQDRPRRARRLRVQAEGPERPARRRHRRHHPQHLDGPGAHEHVGRSDDRRPHHHPRRQLVARDGYRDPRPAHRRGGRECDRASPRERRAVPRQLLPVARG
jgi:hypothetical protein